MASLRRPSVAFPPDKAPHVQPRSQRPQPTLSIPNNDTRRGGRKSKVGDAIKKRMSMRYVGNDTPFSQPPPLPGQAFLSTDPYEAGPSRVPEPEDDDIDEVGGSRFHQFASPEFAQSGFEAATGLTSPQDEAIRRRGATDFTHEEEWNLDELDKEGVDVNAYLKRTLTGADDEEVKRFKAALMRYKEKNAKDLQQNVFKHYAEFVTISKEISTLENDMLELKELLSQWKDLPQLMGMEATLAPKLDKDGNLERRRTQRNSVADLQQMYKSQLTNLWSTVEGSQKYLPVVPGRHLVHESHHFVELNAATYKAKQSVSLFLLNDLLLIAGRRRMKTAVGDDKERDRGRMVAERCWVLADLVVVDVKDSGDLTNALKIRRGKEVCVYRTSRPEYKKELLAAFRQVSQELGEKKRKDNEKEQERRKTMWLGEGNGLGVPPIPGTSTPGRPLSTIGISLADSKDLRWIDELGDELTMAIATRDWDESLKLVERGNDLLKTVASNPAAKDLLSARLGQLKPNLIAQLSHDLSHPDIKKNQAVKLVSQLVRLDRADLARDTFLKARRDIMLKRVREIRAEGDISIYVSELAIVCLTVVRHTSDWYMTAFKENKMASGFVTWAKEQIETFADMFRRQVYAPNIAEGVADECIRVTASHNRKLLRDVGLDFTFLLATLLQPDPASSDNLPHPVFQSALDAQTPAPNYHIEPSPFPPFEINLDTPVASMPDPMSLDKMEGKTAPLAIRRVRPDGGGSRSASGASVASSDRGSGRATPTQASVQAQSQSQIPTLALERQGSNGYSAPDGGRISMERQGSNGYPVSNGGRGQMERQSSNGYSVPDGGRGQLERQESNGYSGPDAGKGLLSPDYTGSSLGNGSARPAPPPRSARRSPVTLGETIR